MSMDIFLKVWQ